MVFYMLGFFHLDHALPHKMLQLHKNKEGDQCTFYSPRAKVKNLAEKVLH